MQDTAEGLEELKMRKGKIFVYEGTDGSGKSIVSSLAAQRLGMLHLETPTDEFREVRKYIDRHTPEIGQFLFYMSTNIDVSRKFEELAEKGIDTICTRYYLSSLVDFSSRMNISVDDLLMKLPIDEKEFYVPDYTILLLVNEEAQRERINHRNRGANMATDELCLSDNQYRKNITEKYLDLAEKNKWHVIDTSFMTIEQVVDASVNHIKGLR